MATAADLVTVARLGRRSSIRRPEPDLCRVPQSLDTEGGALIPRPGSSEQNFEQVPVTIRRVVRTKWSGGPASIFGVIRGERDHDHLRTRRGGVSRVKMFPKDLQMRKG